MTRGVLTALSIGIFLVLTGAVLICVGFTGNALVTANDSLGVVDHDLTSVAGNADPLTAQVHMANNSLTQIEQALNPIHGQADNLNGILTGVNATLTTADGRVKSINNQVGPIESHLVSSNNALGFGPTGEANQLEAPRATGRVTLLDNQVSNLISILTPVEGDLSNIEGNLKFTNDHLASACIRLDVLNLPALPLLGNQSGTC